MKELFILMASQLNSAVFILLIILILAFVATWKLAGWLGAHNQETRNVKERLKEVGEEIKVLPALKERIDIIYSNTMPESRKLTANASPITMTEKGKEVAKKLNVASIVEKTYPDIKTIILEKNKEIEEKNAYDIQQSVFEYFSKSIQDHLSAEELNAFKTEAFTRGVMVIDLYKLLAVLFRDRFLKELGKTPAEHR